MPAPLSLLIACPTIFWLRGPWAISATIEQSQFFAGLAKRTLPFPEVAQQQVAEITRIDGEPGWRLHAKTGRQNVPGAGVGWASPTTSS